MGVAHRAGFVACVDPLCFRSFKYQGQTVLLIQLHRLKGGVRPSRFSFFFFFLFLYFIFVHVFQLSFFFLNFLFFQLFFSIFPFFDLRFFSFLFFCFRLFSFLFWFFFFFLKFGQVKATRVTVGRDTDQSFRVCKSQPLDPEKWH